MMKSLKPKGAKTPAEYLKMLEEPRATELGNLYALIKKTVPSLKPCMISDMIGFGKIAYRTKSGCSGDWFVIGLASQKQYISVYVCVSDGKQYLAEKYADQLGKGSIGKSCIRFKKAEDIDKKVLVKLLKEAEKIQNDGKNAMYD